MPDPVEDRPGRHGSRRQRGAAQQADGIGVVLASGRPQVIADRATVLLRPYQPEGVLGMVEELAAEREKKAASSIRNSITWPNSQPKLGSSRRVITSSGE